jgi:microcin C transport system ATP-binding protein
VLLKTEDLSVAYPSTQSSWFQKPLPHKVLRKVSFSLKQGQTIGVIGESGSGKTTLGMAVLGLLGDSAAQVTGDVDVLGNDWQTLKPVERRAMRVEQRVNRLGLEVTQKVGQDARAGRWRGHRSVLRAVRLNIDR